MYTPTSFFDSHFTGLYRHRLLCAFLSLFFVLMLLMPKPLEAQGTNPDVSNRVEELRATVPTVEDSLRQDEGYWSLKRGVNNVVFFDDDGLHVRSRTFDEDEPYLMMSQSDLPADAMLVEVEARQVKGSLFNGFGFYLMQAPADYIFFYVSSNGYAAIQRAALNSQEMLVPWQESSAIQTQSNATNRLSLLVEEGQATLFVNGSEAVTAGGLALEGATLGLVGTAYEEALVEIAFSGLRYWNLDELSATPTAEQLAATSLFLNDLPEGFEEIPEKELQPWLEDSFLTTFEEDGSVQVMHSFGFWNLGGINIITGESGSIVTPIDGLITYLAATARRDPTMEVLEIAQVGDESGAFVMTSTEEDEPARLEFLIFRRNQVVALLMVGYPDGTESLVKLEELAMLWDSRLADLPEFESFEVAEVDYLKEGKVLFDQAEWSQAVESLTQAIELDPENAEAYYYRGLAHYQLGAEDPAHYVRAIEDLTQAMESEDFFFQASTARNKINQEADAEVLIATYTEQIENSERSAAAYAGRGIVYRDQLGNYEMAIADLTQAIELATPYQRGDYYVERAFAHMENGNAEAAIKDATQAIDDEHTTDICSAYAYRGAQYAELGEYEEAEADLKRARTNCDDDPATLAFVSHQLGIVRYHQGELRDALSLFNDAIDRRVEAARAAARDTWEDDFVSEPEERFEALIGFLETLLAEHQLQAWREGKLESEYAEYVIVFEAYDEIYSGAARSYSWLGAIYEEQSEYERAIEAYTMAIQANPADTDLPNWYVRRGLLFYDQEDFDAAQSDLTIAVTIGRPDVLETAIAYNVLGLIASEEDDPQEELAHYNMAISIAPDVAIFYYNRALTFYELDDYESAIADFEMVLELTEDAALRADVEEWLDDLQ